MAMGFMLLDQPTLAKSDAFARADSGQNLWNAAPRKSEEAGNEPFRQMLNQRLSQSRKTNAASIASAGETASSQQDPQTALIQPEMGQASQKTETEFTNLSADLAQAAPQQLEFDFGEASPVPVRPMPQMSEVEETVEVEPENRMAAMVAAEPEENNVGSEEVDATDSSISAQFTLLRVVSDVLRDMTPEPTTGPEDAVERLILSNRELKNIVFAARNETTFASRFEALIGKINQEQQSAAGTAPSGNGTLTPILLAMQSETGGGWYEVYGALRWQDGDIDRALLADNKPLWQVNVAGNAPANMETMPVVYWQPPQGTKATEWEKGWITKMQDLNVVSLNITTSVNPTSANTEMLPFQDALPLRDLLAEWQKSLRQVLNEQQRVAVEISPNLGDGDGLRSAAVSGGVEKPLHAGGEVTGLTKAAAHANRSAEMVVSNPGQATNHDAPELRALEGIRRELAKQMYFKSHAGTESPVRQPLPGVKHAMSIRPETAATASMAGEAEGNSQPPVSGDLNLRAGGNAGAGNAAEQPVRAEVSNTSRHPDSETAPEPRPDGKPSSRGAWTGTPPVETVLERSGVEPRNGVHQAGRIWKQQQQKILFEQIQQQLRARIQPETSSIKLRLKPESLGQVIVNIELQDGKMSARMLVENHVVKQVLESNIDHLKETLADKGIRAESLDIRIHQNAAQSAKGESAGRSMDQFPEQERRERQQPQRDARQQNDERPKPDFEQLL